jgi:hypothetical protein
MTDIPIKCSCGAFRAQISNVGPRHGNRVVCYCDCCQEFARYLGRADEILDENGGTDIYQASPGRLKILQGQEQLACVHLTDKPTLRWYADCCRTPLGNTINSNKVPFIGLIHSCLDTSGESGGLDQLIGPIRSRVNGSGATGDTSGLKISDKTPLSLYWQFAKLVLGAKMTGAHKKSPLFNPETGRPVAKSIRRKPPSQPDQT